MKKSSEDLLADTLEMQVPSEKESFSASIPLPPRIRLSVEIIGGPDRGTVLQLNTGRLVIGRSDADLVLDDPNVSKKHAAIEAYARTNIYIRDLASTNGTSVNGIQITKQKLTDGDVIQIGEAIMRFRVREDKT
jgi:pSer/pThr/pTyr-binding forkhead associated (FHA) protein